MSFFGFGWDEREREEGRIRHFVFNPSSKGEEEIDEKKLLLLLIIER